MLSNVWMFSAARKFSEFNTRCEALGIGMQFRREIVSLGQRERVVERCLLVAS